jgi:hypothetical protein
MRSGLSYDSFVRLLIQSALSRLTIWTQADLDRLLMLSERLGLHRCRIGWGLDDASCGETIRFQRQAFQND